MTPNLNKVHKLIELGANVAILLVACLLALVLYRNHLRNQPINQTVSQRPGVTTLKGTNLSSLNVNWAEAPQTLLLAISSTCHFCSESGPFYKRLVQYKGTTRIIAILPQPVSEGREYLRHLDVRVDEVKQLGLDTLGVSGTPTLMLVDGSGTVRESWIGKLSADQEASVISNVRH